jgi:FkbM family methyltransferase
VFAQLKENHKPFPDVTLLQTACSDRSGVAIMRVGIDGEAGQLSSISESSAIASNLTSTSLRVSPVTLGDVFEKGRVASDFGVLLVDAEGFELRILQGLGGVAQRPRVIVTEDLLRATYKSTPYSLNWATDS